MSCTVFAGSALANAGKVTGEIDLNLTDKKISARLTYEYVATNDRESLLKFYLNESFVVDRAECRRCRSFRFDKESERLPALTIPLKTPLHKGERIVVQIDYRGSLEEMYHAEHRFLELGLDWFWYPVHHEIGQFNFLYRLTVKSDVPDAKLAGNGRVAKTGKNWSIESKVPDFDIDLVLGERLSFKKYEGDGYDLQVISQDLPEAVATELLSNMRRTLVFYNSGFGGSNPQREVTAVIRPFPESEGQGGYFRKGYFILPKARTAEQFFFPIAHELAHHWWLGAGQQNAWLDESFAEYSALLAVRELRGVGPFDEIVERKRNLDKDLPPIYGFDRTKDPRQSPLVLYVKGALKLYELEKEIGSMKFLAFFREILDQKVKDTDELIELLSRVSSQDVAERFLANLKT